MSGSTARGVVSISIDADGGSRSSAAARDDVVSVVVELLDRFQTHRIAATWAFSDPAGTTLAARRIACEMPQHEVALLVTAPANQSDLSRADVIRNEVRRLQSAAAAGISVTSIAAASHWDARHIDLLTKQGITIVRTDGAPSGFTHGTSRQGISKLDGNGANAVCFGLWQVPVTMTFSSGGWLANRLQLARLTRAVNRTAARGGLCHLRIDAASLASGDVPRSLRTVERFLWHLERSCQQHRITVETLRGTAQRLLPKRSTAAQSILRAA